MLPLLSSLSFTLSPSNKYHHFTAKKSKTQKSNLSSIIIIWLRSVRIDIQFYLAQMLPPQLGYTALINLTLFQTCLFPL